MTKKEFEWMMNEIDILSKTLENGPGSDELISTLVRTMSIIQHREAPRITDRFAFRHDILDALSKLMFGYPLTTIFDGPDDWIPADDEGYILCHRRAPLRLFKDCKKGDLVYLADRFIVTDIDYATGEIKHRTATANEELFVNIVFPVSFPLTLTTDVSHLRVSKKGGHEIIYDYDGHPIRKAFYLTEDGSDIDLEKPAKISDIVKEDEV